MSELNKEQVKQALECCTHIPRPDCNNCPMGEKRGCTIALLGFALKHHKELTKELTRKETEYNELYELLQTYKADSEAYRSYSKTLEKENEALKALLDESYDTQNSLTEENERLKSVEFTCGFVKPHKVLECPIFDEIERTKADTVRKMQTEIEKRCIKGGIYPAFVASTIDQIAKEMVEATNEVS